MAGALGSGIASIEFALPAVEGFVCTPAEAVDAASISTSTSTSTSTHGKAHPRKTQVHDPHELVLSWQMTVTTDGCGKWRYRYHQLRTSVFFFFFFCLRMLSQGAAEKKKGGRQLMHVRTACFFWGREVLCCTAAALRQNPVPVQMRIASHSLI
jgi:hypothetical protein